MTTTRPAEFEGEGLFVETEDVEMADATVTTCMDLIGGMPEYHVLRCGHVVHTHGDESAMCAPNCEGMHRGMQSVSEHILWCEMCHKPQNYVMRFDLQNEKLQRKCRSARPAEKKYTRRRLKRDPIRATFRFELSTRPSNNSVGIARTTTATVQAETETEKYKQIERKYPSDKTTFETFEETQRLNEEQKKRDAEYKKRQSDNTAAERRAAAAAGRLERILAPKARGAARGANNKRNGSINVSQGSALGQTQENCGMKRGKRAEQSDHDSQKQRSNKQMKREAEPESEPEMIIETDQDHLPLNDTQSYWNGEVQAGAASPLGNNGSYDDDEEEWNGIVD